MRSLFIILTVMSLNGFASDIEAIKLAREKLLLKKRVEAAQILRSAIEIEKKETTVILLKKELLSAAVLFFSNEGQRLFELAESIQFAGQKEAIIKYEQGLKFEDDNFQILKALALALLRNREGKKANEYIGRAEKLYPYSDEVQLIKAQAFLLNSEEVDTANLNKIKNSNIEIFKNIIFARVALAKEDYIKATELARQIIEIDKAYPTAYYIQWQGLRKGNESGVESAQKYIQLCKELTPGKRRQYYLDVELCSETTAAEEFVNSVESRQ